MRKAVIWITAIAGLVLLIAMIVMGFGVYDMDVELISTTAYIALGCLVPLFGGLVYIRWGRSVCPHCGKLMLTLLRPKYCPNCGGEVER